MGLHDPFIQLLFCESIVLLTTDEYAAAIRHVPLIDTEWFARALGVFVAVVDDPTLIIDDETLATARPFDEHRKAPVEWMETADGRDQMHDLCQKF
jgi:hypothetical protein